MAAVRSRSGLLSAKGRPEQDQNPESLGQVDPEEIGQEGVSDVWRHCCERVDGQEVLCEEDQREDH